MRLALWMLFSTITISQDAILPTPCGVVSKTWIAIFWYGLIVFFGRDWMLDVWLNFRGYPSISEQG
jgi:hypothetical protein